MLQGDEIRACWQAPSRPVPYEGLFRELRTGGSDEDEVPASRPDDPRDSDRLGTRSWAVPIQPGRAPAVAGGSSGLREATFVPSRSSIRAAGADGGAAGSDDPEDGRIVEDPAVGEGDAHADEAIIHGRALDDTHP